MCLVDQKIRAVAVYSETELYFCSLDLGTQPGLRVLCTQDALHFCTPRPLTSLPTLPRNLTEETKEFRQEEVCLLCLLEFLNLLLFYYFSFVSFIFCCRRYGSARRVRAVTVDWELLVLPFSDLGHDEEGNS